VHFDAPLFFDAMHTLLSTRITRAALKAARPAHRHVMRALRHHSARSRALAEQWRGVKPVDGLRAWFQSFFPELRQQADARRFSLRTLLRKPKPLARPATATGSRSTGRRPRRTLPSSTGWFAFAAR
jgi:hypothetical protein